MPNSYQPSTKPPRPRGLNISLIIVAILSFLGFADASYLTAEHFLTLPLPCALNGCETVLSSKYAMFGPIPTSVLGVVYYLTVLFLTIYILTSEGSPKNIAWIILGITTIGLLMSFFFFYLQIAVIHALCMYCLGSALTTVLLFTSSIFLIKFSYSKNENTPA